jgi:predicted methyltransferase
MPVKKYLTLFALLPLAGCGGGSAPEATDAAADSSNTDAPAADQAMSQPMAADEVAASRDLDAILEAQPEAVKARYVYRKPAETLAFFGVEPGMTVVEALPGGGWYTKILLPYLGEDGLLIGADYPYQQWVVNPSSTPERLEEKKTWVQDWTADAESWRGEGDAAVAAFQMAEMPAEFEGKADVVLFIRALHNLARFEDEAGTLTSAITDAWNALKPGGIVGVIQHEARPDMPDDWADGSNGYLKKDFVIERMEAAGFELVDSTDMHANPKDQPTTDDAVWRLPPGLSGSDEDPELRAERQAIGESNRMTLKFMKPAG